MEGCPKCGNKLGFAFGTCCQCGYNYISDKYDWIKVWRSDLNMTYISPEYEYYLVMKHDKNTTKYK